MTTFSRTLRARCFTGLLCSSVVVTALGCGADFDSPDKVNTLRVFGVQKDHPYATPTVDPSAPSEVQLTMLSHDGSQQAIATRALGETPRTVQRLWFSGCDDLPGDVYFSCLARIYGLWQLRTAIHGDVPLNDGESWSPVDDLPTTQPQRNVALQQLLQLVKPTFPIELAEPYLKTYRIGAGERFTYPIPPRIIEDHRPSSDSNIPPYGLAFVFFTVCAGESPKLQLAPEWQNIDLGTSLTDATLGFPLICRDGAGSALDSDNYITGYTQQYVYGDGSANLNPVIDGVEFNGVTYNFKPEIPDEIVQENPTLAAEIAEAAANAICLDGDCVPAAKSEISIDPCDSKYAEYVPHATACSSHCPTYAVKPVMTDTENDDVDTFTSAGGSPVGEQMWINYYADRGEFDGSARSLRDTTLGWFDDHGQKWKPPASADVGPALLWAVVHDNRGGVAWLRVQVCIDP